MSYGRFNKDIDHALEHIKEHNSCGRMTAPLESVRKATATVFEQWFKEERFQDLAKWFPEYFDSGGGDEYLYRIGDALLKKGDRDAFVRLLRAAIYKRERSFWAWRQVPTVVEGAKERTSALHNETLGALSYFAAALEGIGADDVLETVKEGLQRSKGRDSKLKMRG